MVYTATMNTRKTNSSSNTISGKAAQERYSSSYNYVGIISFSSMMPSTKSIIKMVFTITSDSAGLNSYKTAYICRSNYQSANASGVSGASYAGALLGTFYEQFYGNTKTITLDKDHNSALFNSLKSYFAAGNNTITLYNSAPGGAGNHGSENYLIWSSVSVNITYGEEPTVPTVSSSSVVLGNSVTITTQNQSSTARHTLRYSFVNASGTIATNVESSASWTPSETLQQQIPSSTSGTCTIYCDTYESGVLTGTKSVDLVLIVPQAAEPTIEITSVTDHNTAIATQFGEFIKGKSALDIALTGGTIGSTIESIRTTVDGTTYYGYDGTFTTKTLTTAGELTIETVLTDSRGATASDSTTITVLDYALPVVSTFKPERCNADGTEAQTDGNHVRFSLAASVSDLDEQNTLSWVVSYRQLGGVSWTQIASGSPTDTYSVNITNQLVQNVTFDPMHSYEFKVSVSDYFQTPTTITQTVSTKSVVYDCHDEGKGIAFGKVSENEDVAEFHWPLKLEEPLAVSEGGTGATNAAAAIANLGGIGLAGGEITGLLKAIGNNGGIQITNPSETHSITIRQTNMLQGHKFQILGDGNTADQKVIMEIDSVNPENSTFAGSAGGFGVLPIASGGTGASTTLGALQNLGDYSASSGYFAFGDLLIRWGVVNNGTISFPSSFTVNFSLSDNEAFDSAPSVMFLPFYSGAVQGGIAISPILHSVNVSSFQGYLLCNLTSGSLSGVQTYWIAIGKRRRA